MGADVQVVDVEAGVHHADGDGAARRSSEEARRVFMETHRIRPHGRNRRVVAGPKHLHRLDRLHEVGLQSGIEGGGIDVGRVGADVGIETPDLDAIGLQRAPPTTVPIVRHQRDQNGELAKRRSMDFRPEGRVRFAFRRRHAEARHARQRRGGLEAGVVRRQAAAQQLPRCGQNVDSKRRDGVAHVLRRGPFGEAQPAKRPIALHPLRQIRDGRQRRVASAGIAKKPIQGLVGRGRVPFRRWPVGSHGQFRGRRGEGVAIGRCWRRGGKRLDGGGARIDNDRRGLNGRLAHAPFALRGNLEAGAFEAWGAVRELGRGNSRTAVQHDNRSGSRTEHGDHAQHTQSRPAHRVPNSS